MLEQGDPGLGSGGASAAVALPRPAFRLGLLELDRCVYHSHMGEGLREVTQQLARLAVNLLAVEAHVIRVAQSFSISASARSISPR